MIDKKYRYSNFLDGKIISESDWLLQASNSQGQIYDNLRKKFIEPHPYPFLIDDAFNIKSLSSFFEGEQALSVILAKEEKEGLKSTIFSIANERNVLLALCLNPEVKIEFNDGFRLSDILDKRNWRDFLRR